VLAALLRRAAASFQQPLLQHQLQPLGALKQLQRGLASSGRFTDTAGGAAAAAAAGRAPWLAAVAAGLSAGMGLQLYSGSDSAQCKAATAAADQPSDAKSRIIDKEEVAKHRTKETGGRRMCTGRGCRVCASKPRSCRAPHASFMYHPNPTCINIAADAPTSLNLLQHHTLSCRRMGDVQGWGV
jgi:hypothetical protein